MTATKQSFPAVSIEAMPCGLFRLEDEHGLDGPQIIDLHPVQVQVLAALVGFALPDRTREALERLASRLHCLHEQAGELAGLLNREPVPEGLNGAAAELACRFIAGGLGELLADLEGICAAALEPVTDAPANQGGQLSLLA